MDDDLIIVMHFTLLLWYTGFPSAALALGSQNLFVFLVSMPPVRRILLSDSSLGCLLCMFCIGDIPMCCTWILQEHWKCKKKKWPPREGGCRFRCLPSHTGRIQTLRCPCTDFHGCVLRFKEDTYITVVNPTVGLGLLGWGGRQPVKFGNVVYLFLCTYLGVCLGIATEFFFCTGFAEVSGCASRGWGRGCTMSASLKQQ